MEKIELAKKALLVMLSGAYVTLNSKGLEKAIAHKVDVNKLQIHDINSGYYLTLFDGRDLVIDTFDIEDIVLI